MQNSRSVQLAMFAMVVFGGVETPLADPIYTFTTIDAPDEAWSLWTGALGINNSGQIAGVGSPDGWDIVGFVYTGGNHHYQCPWGHYWHQCQWDQQQRPDRRKGATGAHGFLASYAVVGLIDEYEFVVMPILGFSGPRADVVRGAIEASRLEARESAGVRLGGGGDAV